MITRHLMFVLLPLVAAAALVGQQTSALADEFPHTDSLQGSTAIEQVDGVLTAGGWDYQATFTPRGMRFVPVLGSNTPVTQHLTLALTEVRRGERLVFAAPAAGARPAHADGQPAILIPHTGSLLERYDVTSRGLELSLRFDQLPAGSGDLVVRYQLDTSLVASPVGPEGVSFLLDGVGGVHIGGVTGIDAIGNRTAGSLRLAGDQLELVLPAAFVDRAAYPLTLDPLIGSQFAAQTGSWSDSQPDVAYDATNDLYLVVFRRAFSATSIDLRGQRISAGGSLIGSYFGIETGAPLSLNPTVANLNQRDSFVVAWQQADTIWSPWNLKCCAVNASTGAVSTTTALAGSSEATDPDAAGDNTTNQDRALIVYNLVGSGIRLARVAVNAPGAAPILVSTNTVTAAASARHPAISKSPPSAGAYVATWSENSLLTRYIRAQACDRNGAMLGNVTTVTSGTLAVGPDVADVDGNGSEYLVVYDRYEAASANSERDVWCRRLSWNGTSLSIQGAPVPLDTTTSTDQTDVVVAWCRYKFVVLYADQVFPGANNYDVRGVELGADGATCGSPFLLTGLNATLLRNNEFTPAIASEYGGGAPSDDALLVFAEADDAPPFSSTVIGQRYSALGPGGAITLVGSSCGAGATIGTSGGPFAVGNTHFRVTLTGAQPGVIPVILIGLPGGETGCGPCVLTNYVASQFILPIFGSASYAYSLPCSTRQFVGLPLQMQWALLLTNQNPCPLAAGLGLSMTQRLRLTIGL